MEELYIKPVTYTLNPLFGTYTVSRCDKDTVNVVIPSDIDGQPVIGIDSEAFDGCAMLSSVQLPTGEEPIYEYVRFSRIGEYAFNECVSLREIIAPVGLERIGRGAFRGCKMLTRVTFPEGISVGDYAFYGCETLTHVTPVRDVGEGTFSHCKALEYFPVDPRSEEIGEDAFEHCYALKKVVIPKNVKRIGPLVFRNCHALASVRFEAPEAWYCTSRYMSVGKRDLDLSDPERNARWLRTADFDDGGAGWYKRTRS